MHTGAHRTRFPLSPQGSKVRSRPHWGWGAALLVLGVAAIAANAARVPALAAAGAVVAVLGVVMLLRGKKKPSMRGVVEWKNGKLTRDVDGVRAELVDDAEAFGITVLANRRRTRLLLAFTRRSTTRFLSVHLDDADETTRRELVAMAATVPEGDALDVDGAEVGLAPDDALVLVRLMERTHPSALKALYLSTSRGEPLVLEGHDMHLGERKFDLRAPLEWRPFVFHESSGAVTTLYQATWVRQRGDELVLVAPMPLDVIPRSAQALGGRSAEIRILAQTSESPPPRELRVAIDRMFMLPLRRALDGAPAPKRAPMAPPAAGQGKAARTSTSDS